MTKLMPLRTKSTKLKIKSKTLRTQSTKLRTKWTTKWTTIITILTTISCKVADDKQQRHLVYNKITNTNTNTMTKTKKILGLVTFESLQCNDALNTMMTIWIQLWPDICRPKKYFPGVDGWVKVKIVHLFIIFLPSCPKISFFPISGSYLEKFEAGHIKLLEAVG